MDGSKMQAWSTDQIAELRRRSLAIARREGATDPESIAQDGLVALTERYTPDEIESEDKSAPLHTIIKRLIAKSKSSPLERGDDEMVEESISAPEPCGQRDEPPELSRDETVDGLMEYSRRIARERFAEAFGRPFLSEYEPHLESLLHDAKREAAALQEAEKAFAALWKAWAGVLGVVTGHSCHNAPAEAMKELVEESLPTWKRIVARISGETSLETASDLLEYMRSVEELGVSWVPIPKAELYMFVWLIDRTWTLPWSKLHSPLENTEIATLLVRAGYEPKFEKDPEHTWDIFERVSREVGRARKKYPTDPEDCADRVGLASPES